MKINICQYFKMYANKPGNLNFKYRIFVHHHIIDNEKHKK